MPRTSMNYTSDLSMLCGAMIGLANRRRAWVWPTQSVGRTNNRRRFVAINAGWMDATTADRAE